MSHLISYLKYVTLFKTALTLFYSQPLDLQHAYYKLFVSKIVRDATFTQCCGSGSGIRSLFDLWIRDPGWVKILRPRSGIRIRDEHPGTYVLPRP